MKAEAIIKTLAARREELEWSMTRVSRAINKLAGKQSTTAFVVGNWEEGKTQPLLHNLILWAEVLGIELILVDKGVKV